MVSSNRDATEALSAVQPARTRASEETSGAFAPTSPTGERDFFAERLALFTQIATFASSGFLLMRIVIRLLAQRAGVPESVIESFSYFHLAATATFLVM